MTPGERVTGDPAGVAETADAPAISPRSTEDDLQEKSAETPEERALRAERKRVRQKAFVEQARTAPPHEPHMSPAQIELFKSLLTGTSMMLEYGAGGSTYLAAGAGVGKIVSVESDKEFALAVCRKVVDAFPDVDLVMLTPNIGPTGVWGRPVGRKGAKDWPAYPLSPWLRLEGQTQRPDLVLIDGRFRAACFLVSVMMGKVGSRILFDDYVGREQSYRIAEKYAARIETVDKMAVFEIGDLDVSSLRTLALDLAAHCVQPA